MGADTFVLRLFKIWLKAWPDFFVPGDKFYRVRIFCLWPLNDFLIPATFFGIERVFLLIQG